VLSSSSRDPALCGSVLLDILPSVSFKLALLSNPAGAVFIFDSSHASISLLGNFFGRDDVDFDNSVGDFFFSKRGFAETTSLSILSSDFFLIAALGDLVRLWMVGTGSLSLDTNLFELVVLSLACSVGLLTRSGVFVPGFVRWSRLMARDKQTEMPDFSFFFNGEFPRLPGSHFGCKLGKI